MGTLSAAWGAGMVIGPGIGGKSPPPPPSYPVLSTSVLALEQTSDFDFSFLENV